MTQSSPTVQSSDDSSDDQLPRMYRGYDDDHDAETLDDFGLDLTLDEGSGVLVPPETVSRFPLQTERTDEFPVEHVVVHPIGVGPVAPDVANLGVDGMESVFVYLHPVREYDSPGHYVQAESMHTVARMERSEFERYCEQHTIVEAIDEGLYHWQDPENDPRGYCDRDR